MGSNAIALSIPLNHHEDFLVSNILQDLRGSGLVITSVEPISCATQIRLACGAVINVFTTGKVVVQGAVHKQYRQRVLQLLKQVLPVNTTWCL